MDEERVNRQYTYIVHADNDRREFKELNEANKFYDECKNGAILVQNTSSIIAFKF